MVASSVSASTSKLRPQCGQRSVSIAGNLSSFYGAGWRRPIRRTPPELEGWRERCHLRCKSAKAPGWVIHAPTHGRPSCARSPSCRLSSTLGPPSFRYFNVAIATAEKAVAAARKHLGDTHDGETSAVRALSAGEIAALGLTAG